MSDPYSFDDLADPSDPINFALAQQRATTAHVLSTLDDDPEEAVRAREVSRDLGVPPVVVKGDLEHYTAQHKAILTADLIRNNKFLAAHAASSPLAASISSDDWGQLDEVSNSAKTLGTLLGVPYPDTALSSISSKAGQGFAEFWGERPGEWMQRAFSSAEGKKFAEDYPQLAGLTGIAGLLGTAGIEIPAKIFSGLIGAGLHGFTESLIQTGVDEQKASRIARDITGMLEHYVISGGAGMHPVKPEGIKRPTVTTQGLEFKPTPEMIDQVQANKLMHYITRGEKPPLGISPIYDMLKFEEAKNDRKALDKVEKDVDAANTTKRSPEDMASFLRQPFGEATIGVDSSAIRQLYGDKPPGLEDGIFGGLLTEEQLRLAEKTGGDINIPLADWLGRVPKEVRDELHDFTRIRPDGVNLEETKFFKQHETEVAAKNEEHGYGEPLSSGDVGVDSINAAAKYDSPLDEARQAKLKLERTGKPSKAEPLEGVPPHNFSLTDPTGKDVGEISVSETNNGKSLYVNWWGAEAGPQSLGPRVIRDLLAQIKQEFPNAEEIGGWRISGAREKAGVTGPTTIKLDAPTEADLASITDFIRRAQAPEGMWITYGDGVRALIQPSKFYSTNERVLAETMDKVFARVAPGLQTIEATAVEAPIGMVKGVHISEKEGRDALVIYTLTNTTARHEALHYLRAKDFITREEWSTLEKAAIDNGWMEKYDIDRRYKDLDPESKLEEAVVEGYADWGRGIKEPNTAIEAIWQKLKDLFDQLRQSIKEAFGKDITFEDLFQQIERGEVGQRAATEELSAAAMPRRLGAFKPKAQAPKEPELPQAGTTRMEERKPFDRGMTIGIPQKNWNVLQKLIEQDESEVAAKIAERVNRDETRRQTKEWKDNFAELRKEVEPKILERPDIALDQLFAKGIFHGYRIPGRIPKLAAKALTEEQRKRLPEKYISEEGFDPNDIAGQFGYGSGDALIQRLSNIEDARKESGLKGKAFIDKLIDEETDRQMVQKYGKLSENIDRETKDIVASDTKLRRIHEEILAVVQKVTGVEISLTKEMLEEGLINDLNQQKGGHISSDAYLRDAGRAGKKAEFELLVRGDPNAYSLAKQAQYKATYLARLALKHEALMEKLDKLEDRWDVRNDKGIDQEYLNQAHAVMLIIGRDIKRTPLDIATSQQALAKERGKLADTLGGFITNKESQLRDFEKVPQWLIDQQTPVRFADLTVERQRQAYEALTNMIHVGKNEMKAFKAQEAAEFESVKEEVIKSLETFAPKIYDPENGRWLTPWIPPKLAEPIRNYGYAHLQMETIFNRIDRGNPWGVVTQYMFRDLADSATKERSLEREYSKLFRELKEGKIDRKKLIENPFIMEPYSMDRAGRGAGQPVPKKLTQVNLRAIILNMGNRSNKEAFLRGYKIPEEVWPAFDEWLERVSTPEDWAWAQKYGDIFKKFKDEHVDPMYTRINGIAPDSLDIQPFANAHGSFDGWYYPKIHDPLNEGTSKKLMGQDALEGEHYVRATTANGYVERRTGYIAPIDLTLDRGVTRLKQEIHDVAFREAIINASKFYYDKDIRNAITHHFSKEAKDLLIPYLQDVANSANLKSEIHAIGGSIGEAIRQNLISVLVGWNPATVAKHGLTALWQSGQEVGWRELGEAYASLFSRDDRTGESNWAFALRMSEELASRHRHYMEVMRGGTENMFKTHTLRDTMLYSGAFFVSRSDLFSAVPAWLAQYKKTLAETGNIGDAVYAADRAVRRAHGSTAITSRAKIVRQGNTWFTSLYGFFNHIMNRQYEIAWKAADAMDKMEGRYLPGESREIRMVRQPDGSYAPAKFKAGAAAVPGLAAAITAYLLVPAAIEELVSPLPHDEEDDVSKIAAKGLLKTASSSWVYGRDVAQAVLTGHDPSAGILSTAYKQFTDVTRDMSKEEPFSEDNAGATLQHSINLFGMVTGLTNGEMGRRARMMHDMLVDKEKTPEDIEEWWNVLIHSTAEYPRPRGGRR